MGNDVEIGRRSFFEPAYKLAIELMRDSPDCGMIVLGEDKLIILKDPTE